MADTGVAIPGPPNYRTSQTFHHEQNVREAPLPETMARLFRNPFTDGSMVTHETPRTYRSWSEYFDVKRAETEATASTSTIEGTRPLQVRPRPRPFTLHPELITVEQSSDNEMELLGGDTEPNSPEHPPTPPEQMDEDDMRRLHPALPSNADLLAAGDTGIELTKEQHRILMSQMEGSTIICETCEQQQVEEVEPMPNFVDGECQALTGIRNALHMGIRLEGLNGDEPLDIEHLVQDDDPPILWAFAQELENWPELDQILEETFSSEPR